MILEHDLAELETASLEALRATWRRHYGVPPKLRSPELLRRIIAWRMQVKAEGGLDAKTRALLLRDSHGPELLLAIGTVIAREWKGVRHEVEITDDGPLYANKRWKSLSEIARSITGTRWNGPRFFGLRQER